MERRTFEAQLSTQPHQITTIQNERRVKDPKTILLSCIPTTSHNTLTWTDYHPTNPEILIAEGYVSVKPLARNGDELPAFDPKKTTAILKSQSGEMLVFKKTSTEDVTFTKYNLREVVGFKVKQARGLKTAKK